MRRNLALCVGMFVWGFAAVLAGAEPTPPRVLTIKGALAVQETEGKPWQVVSEGMELPNDCRLQTFDGGASIVELAQGGILHIASHSRLHVSGAGKELELASGKVFLQTPEKAALTVRLPGIRATARNGAAEFAAEPNKPLAISVCEGLVEWKAQKKQVKITAGTKLLWQTGDGEPAPEALAEEERAKIERWTARPHGVGRLTIKDAQGHEQGALSRLEVARYHVNVVLQPPVALVQIDQSFYNPYQRQEEGTFVFNLPRGASVSRFAMYVAPQQLIEGELIERKQADMIYQSIVRARRDPAILEQIGDNLFKIRVFPVPARDTKRILLDFTLPLEAADNVCSFALPLLADRDPIWDFKVSGVLRGAAPKSAVCLSHPEAQLQEREGGDVAFTLEKTNYRPKTDLALRFAVAHQAKSEVRSFVAESIPDSGEPDMTYFQATLPNDSAVQAAATGPADVLILAETSSSIGRSSLLVPAVRSVLENLRSEDRVRILCVDVAAREIHDGWRASDAINANNPLQRLSEQICLGGLDLAACFPQAMKSFEGRPDGRRRIVVFIGSGDNSLGLGPARELPAVLAKSVQDCEAQLSAVLIAPSDGGQALFDKAAKACGGVVFDRARDASASRAWFRYVLAGMPPRDRIAKVKVQGAQAEDLFYPPSVAPGSPVTIFGRTTAADKIEVEVTLEREGREITLRRDAALSKAEGDLFLGRLWAQKKLDQLSAASTDASAEVAPGNKERALRLSREWSLLSPQMAFLVLENEAEYKQYGLVRQERRRYWKPADAVSERPLPQEWLAKAKQQAKAADQASLDKRVANTLEAARKAIEAGNCIQAQNILQDAAMPYPEIPTITPLDKALGPAIKASSEAKELLEKATVGAVVQRRIESLGRGRLYVDPVSSIDLARPKVELSALFGATISGNPEFFKRHPYADQLLQTMPIKAGTIRLCELVEQLRSRIAGNVLVDERALLDFGVSLDAPVELTGRGEVSVRSYARWILRQLDLTMIEEPHRLLITTEETAESMLTTVAYPVNDLVSFAPLKDLSLLNHPYYDRNQAVENRIKEALCKPVSFDFTKKPLTKLASELAEELGTAVVLDRKALEDLGISIDSPVSAHWRDVPLGESLRWMFEDLDLETMVRNEALVITTKETAEANPIVRLHSVCGLVEGWPVPTMPTPGVPLWMWGGRGMGMGGMGGGMGMGSFGGGFGGGMGGFGGAMDPPGASQSIGSRDWADADDVDSEPEEIEANTDANGGAMRGGLEADRTLFGGGGGGQADFDSIISMITSTVRPTAWDEVGGPGGMCVFEPTLDLVVSQTDQVHEEIETYLSDLRRMPRANGLQTTVLAELPKDVEEGLGDGPRYPDFDTLISLITSIVSPTTWDDVGGPGSIMPEESRCALIFSQTHDVHETVADLLVALRRSRYEGLHGDRPWERALDPNLPLFAPLATEVGAVREVAQLPPPRPERLALLKIRRQDTQQKTINRYVAGAEGDETYVYATFSGDVVQLAFDDASFQVRGDEATAQYHSLGLEESGEWAEAVRRLADHWLPWMPHRTNEELARLFRIESIKEDPSPVGQVRLKLTPVGLTGNEQTYLDVAFSEPDGQPVRWDCYQRGKLAGRYLFNRPEIRLENAEGKVLVTWHESDWGRSSPKAVAGGYLKISKQRLTKNGPNDLETALFAMRKGKWADAEIALCRAAKAHLGHPLLALLRAWCYQHDPAIASREDVTTSLKEAIVNHPALGRSLGGGKITWLTPLQRYEILQAGLPAERTAEDWDMLLDAAIQAEKLGDALDCVERMPWDNARNLARSRKRFELLLRLGRNDEADKAALPVMEAGARLDHWAAKGDLAVKYGRKELADRLYERALLVEGTDAWTRSNVLTRRALVTEGEKHFKLLLQAALVEAKTAAAWPTCLHQLYLELGTLHDPKLVLSVASEADDPRIKAELTILAAEQTDDAGAAADLVWELQQSDALPAEYHAWAFGLWNKAGHASFTIQVAEELLWRSKRLDAGELFGLEDAYRASGRKADARRAATALPQRPPRVEPVAPSRARPWWRQGSGGFM